MAGKKFIYNWSDDEILKKRQVCALVLAAGISTRMGTTKQLLKLNGEYLLESVINLALLEEFSKVYAIIGHEAKKIQQSIAISDKRFQWVVNNNYRQGMSSSLKLGIKETSKHCSHVIIFLGDLPFISSNTVQTIYKEGVILLDKEQDSFVLQPSYLNRPGHPVFFGNLHLKTFEGITGDQGAKSIMNTMNRRILNVNDPGILFDIDTLEAYEEAKKRKRLN